MSFSADGDDYPQVRAGSEINSDYAGDSQRSHRHEACGETPVITRTRTVQ
jgi:hypothetical protein